jgi:sugar (pentulose or hexulose) kinase
MMYVSIAFGVHAIFWTLLNFLFWYAQKNPDDVPQATVFMLATSYAAAFLTYCWSK